MNFCCWFHLWGSCSICIWIWFVLCFFLWIIFFASLRFIGDILLMNRLWSCFSFLLLFFLEVFIDSLTWNLRILFLLLLSLPSFFGRSWYPGSVICFLTCRMRSLGIVVWCHHLFLILQVLRGNHDFSGYCFWLFPCFYLDSCLLYFYQQKLDTVSGMWFWHFWCSYFDWTFISLLLPCFSSYWSIFLWDVRDRWSWFYIVWRCW